MKNLIVLLCLLALSCKQNDNPVEVTVNYPETNPIQMTFMYVHHYSIGTDWAVWQVKNTTTKTIDSVGVVVTRETKDTYDYFHGSLSAGEVYIIETTLYSSLKPYWKK